MPMVSIMPVQLAALRRQLPLCAWGHLLKPLLLRQVGDTVPHEISVTNERFPLATVITFISLMTYDIVDYNITYHTLTTIATASAC